MPTGASLGQQSIWSRVRRCACARAKTGTHARARRSLRNLTRAAIPPKRCDRGRPCGQGKGLRTGNAPEQRTCTHKKSPCLNETRGFLRSCWCPGAESNHRHEDFQISCRRKSTILSSSRLSDVLFRWLILPTKDQLRSSYTGFSIFQFRESGKIRVGAPRRAYSDRLPGGCLPKIE
jgi:hypothetical protein